MDENVYTTCTTCMCMCTYTHTDENDVEKYMEILKRNEYKKATLTRIKSSLKRMSEEYHKLGYERPLKEMTEEQARILMSTLKFAESTKNVHFNALKNFTKFYGNHNLENIKIMMNGNYPNVKWISEEELCILLNIAEPLDKMIIHLGGNYGPDENRWTYKSANDRKIFANRCYTFGRRDC